MRQNMHNLKEGNNIRSYMKEFQEMKFEIPSMPDSEVLDMFARGLQEWGIDGGRHMRKATMSALESDQLLSIYCENLPFSWTTSDILSTLSTYGEIVDIYIPSEKSKSGKRFGFIRFKKGPRLEGVIEAISKVPVGNGFLHASWARKKTVISSEVQH
ncbi:hypothetical protein Tsubulata_022106 [Turnera subulata]|uniref:RRM domain-containing protein n=1 Tax=Turnera subulata TaxID=218843 RepID=A0A9Q0FE59_9ROSI|nr:hypothetical protein Tsubulata_022106 [Turnera subulata]